MNVITRGIRNAFRNAVRTLSIVLILGLSIGLSLIMLIAHQAVGDKISQVKRSIGNVVTIQPAGYSSFSLVNNTLTTGQLGNVQSLPHVASVSESLTDHVNTIGAGTIDASAGTTSLTSPVNLSTSNIMIRTASGKLPPNFSLPIQVLGTTDPAHISGVDVKVTNGSMIDGSKDVNDVLVSTNMASKNNLHVGSTFQAYNTTMTVSGIFDSGIQSGNNTIIMSLPTLQKLSNQSNVISNAQVKVDSIDHLATVTTAIKNSLGSAADVQNSQDEVNNAVKPLENIQTISLYSLMGAVVAGGVILLLVMIMIVRERRHEIGILKAIGASNIRIMFQFMAEALTLTILGAAVGLVIGVTGGNPVTKVLVSSSVNTSSSSSSSNSIRGAGVVTQASQASFNAVSNSIRDIHANVGWVVLAYGFGAAVLIALSGSATAAGLIAKVRPSEVLRSE